MAIRNPPDLYNGAAVAFNTMPYLQFQLKSLAEKKAKDEALDEYYKKLPTTINDQGVRDEEREVISRQMLPELEKHWYDNKEKIKNPKLDGGAAQLKHEKMFRDIRDLVERSKYAGKIGLEVGKWRFDPKMSYVFDDEDVIDQIRRHQLPLTDPEHQTIDLLKMTAPAAPFEQDKYLKQFENVPMEQLPAEVTRDAKNFTRTITQRSTYGKPGLEAIHNRAATQFASDKSFRSFVKKQLDNPESLKELNGVFKKNYGKDIQTYDDLAAAYTIKSLPEKVTTKTEDDRLAFDLLNDRQQRARDERNNQNAIARLRMNDQLVRGRKADGVGEKSDEVFLDDYLDELSKTGEKVYYSGGSGNEVALDPVIANALTINGAVPDKLIATDDGKFLPIYFKYKTVEKNGAKTVELETDEHDRPVVDKTISKPITQQQMKLAMGVKSTTGKQRVKEMTNKPQSKKAELD